MKERAAIHEPAREAPSGRSRPTRLCPYCAEEIYAEAVKCRYCRERLDGRRGRGRRLVVFAVGFCVFLLGCLFYCLIRYGVGTGIEVFLGPWLLFHVLLSLAGGFAAAYLFD